MPAPEHTGVNSGCPSGGQSPGGDGGSAGHVAAEIRGQRLVCGERRCVHTPLKPWGWGGGQGRLLEEEISSQSSRMS